MRPCESGSVNLKLTIPSGPKTDDGILSNESERDFVSADCSCKLLFYLKYYIINSKISFIKKSKCEINYLRKEKKGKDKSDVYVCEKLL